MWKLGDDIIQNKISWTIILRRVEIEVTSKEGRELRIGLIGRVRRRGGITNNLIGLIRKV